MSDLSVRVKSLLAAEPSPDKCYYALSVLMAEDGRIEFSTQTQWVGYTEDTPGREIREASLVHADRMLHAWRELGESGKLLSNEEQTAHLQTGLLP